jgi:hypothetical protein
VLLSKRRSGSSESESKRERLAMSSGMEMAGGGVEDAYGEDRATEEQLITPWAFSVARSVRSLPHCYCPPEIPISFHAMILCVGLSICGARSDSP